MNVTIYSHDDRQLLLTLARKAIATAAHGLLPPSIRVENYPEHLQAERACFVTLQKAGQLRGCIGVLQPRMPLVQEVISSAQSAASEDPRFRPLTPEEVDQVTIEISILSVPEALTFETPLDIPKLLRPGLDGVILRKGYFRATFLPQVWSQLPDPIDFLEHLSQKMGLNKDAWKDPKIEVETYQVVEFSE